MVSTFDENIAMAKLIYEEKGTLALKNLWTEYLEIAKKYNLPFLATTPTRRANKERVQMAGCESSVIIDNVKFLQEIQKEAEAKEFHKWQADLFAEDMVRLKEISKVKIFGGCCGTDNRHMEQVAKRI